MLTRWRLLPLLLVPFAVALSGCRKSTPWSPDSKQIALEAHGGIQLYDTVAGKLRPLVPGELKQHEALAPTWSPDSRQLAFFDAQRQGEGLATSLVTIDAATGKRTTLVPALKNTVEESTAEDPLAPVRDYCSAAWSPDGRELAYLTVEAGRQMLWTVPAAGGAPHRLTPPDRQLTAPSWSPDSQTLLVASAPVAQDAIWELELIDRDGTHRRSLCRAPNGLEVGSGGQWSPDGKQVGVIFHRTTRENEPEACEAWIVSVPDGGFRKLADIPGPAWSASLTTDLRTVVFLQPADPNAGRPVDVPAVLEAPYTAPRRLRHAAEYDSPSMTIPMVSPDGKTIALLIQQGDRLPLLGLRYLDDRGPVDLTIEK